MKVRLAKDPSRKQDPEPARPDEQPDRDGTKRPLPRGLTERQWFIGLLVAAGLLLLLTFRGCILPSGVGPKAKPSAKPTAAPTGQATAGTTAGGEYTVQSGDSLSKIADKNGVSLDALLQANNLSRGSILQVGQKLKIPK